MESSNTSDDNPFAGPKAPVPGKVLVQMPTEDSLCSKLSKLNITLVKGYPSCSSVACWKTSSWDQQSHKPHGMGCFPTRKLTLLQSRPGVLMLVNSIVVTVGLLERPACLPSHLHLVVFHKRQCVDRRSRQGRLLWFVTRQLASTDAFLKCRK